MACVLTECDRWWQHHDDHVVVVYISVNVLLIQCHILGMYRISFWKMTGNCVLVAWFSQRQTQIHTQDYLDTSLQQNKTCFSNFFYQKHTPKIDNICDPFATAGLLAHVKQWQLLPSKPKADRSDRVGVVLLNSLPSSFIYLCRIRKINFMQY